MRIRCAASAALSTLLPAFAAIAAAPPADAPLAKPGPGAVVVHTALGGTILGYDIEPAGTQGLLSEAVTLADGRANVAVETFDVRTGAILEIVQQLADSKNDFVTFGIYNGNVGLEEYEQVRTRYVDKRSYPVMNPLEGGRFTGTWTPPFSAAEDIIGGGATAYGSDQAAFIGFVNNATDFSSYVFSSDVAANTFGPVLRVPDPIFNWDNSPVMALDPVRNQVILGGSDGCYLCSTRIAQMDLTTGQFNEIVGQGKGFINGIAVDPQTGMVCTATEDDFSVEFYNLATGQFRVVVLPHAFDQTQSGQAVAVDTVHGLFLIGQVFSSTALHGSSIQVYDEQGNFVESLNGFQLPASPANMALDPANRTGFVITAPGLSTLQSFTY